MHLDPVSSGALAPTLRRRKPEARNLAYYWTNEMGLQLLLQGWGALAPLLL